MKNKINKDLISNIEISEDTKRALYKNCLKGKSTADFRFKYSGVLSILIIVAVFGITSIGASAAIISVTKRLENMDAEEYDGYQYEVDNDEFVCTSEGFSRDLTDEEIIRIIDLERDYYDRGVYPEKSLAHYQTKKEMKEGELAYVAEDNLVYLPDEMMNDEELLEYIDHDAKKRYVNIQELKAEGIEPGVNMALESTPITPGTEESEMRELSDKYLKEVFNVDLDDSWIVLLDRFEDEELPNGDIITLYNVNYYRLGVGYATSYNIRLNANDKSALLLQESGYEPYLKTKHFTFDEAEIFAEKSQDTVMDFVNKYSSLGEPDSISYSVDDYAEDNTTPCVYYYIKYGATEVSVELRIEDQKIITYWRW